MASNKERPPDAPERNTGGPLTNGATVSLTARRQEEFTLPFLPYPFARPRVQTGWKKAQPGKAPKTFAKIFEAKKYAASKAAIALVAAPRAPQVAPPWPVEVRLVFVYKVAKSWTNKKKAAALLGYHTTKPDVDNLVKTVLDALQGLFWEDDQQVYKLTAEKRYGQREETQVGIVWRHDVE